MTDVAARPELLIVGAGGHAAVVADIARVTGHEVAGFIDTVHPERAGTSFCGAVILGGLEECLRLRRSGVSAAVVAIGDCHARVSLGRWLEEQGFVLATLRHPSAVVAADVELAAGCVVAAGAIVNPAARIGAHVILNTACSVDHHCVVGEGVHVCPGVRLGGGVTVDEQAWVGIGATVSNGLRIGRRAMIGAGSVVVREVPPDVVVRGVPARVARAR